MKNDIKKHILFLRNENSLNLIIRNEPKITNNLNNKLQKKLLNNSKFYFNINSIDNLEYKDLEQIYNSIEKANNHKSNSLKKARK